MKIRCMITDNQEYISIGESDVNLPFWDGHKLNGVVTEETDQESEDMLDERRGSDAENGDAEGNE